MQALDVDHVLWGNPTLNTLGRVPKAALVALQLNASLLLFGTGASFSDVGHVVEAEYARRMLDDPLRLRAFRGHFDAFADDELLALRSKCELELTSLNTVQEIRAAAKIFVSRKIERLVLVSSNTHAPRCLRDASVVLAELAGSSAESADDRAAFFRLSQNLLVSPSDVPYLNATPQMVQIVEPPHRPDTLVSFDRHVARFFKVPRERHAELAAQIDALLRDQFNV
jgi:uncharacterized SAM-binding protein YcdF (DUF218 family)